MNNKEKTLLWLSLCDFITPKKQRSFLQLIDDGYNLDVWSDCNSYKLPYSQIVTEAEFNKMMFVKDDNYINSFIKNLSLQDIEIVTLYSENYPLLLKEIDSPPLMLYCKGNIQLLNSECLAVVGTRRPTKYGNDITEKFVSEISRSGVTIVSGLADGIDTVAHNAALEVGGNTIAVLGGGINEIYPISNIKLANKMFQKGLVISEYKPNGKPQQFYFPARNRIIAGLSKGVLITEAGEKSGSMHTKNYAVEYNRNLFVVPGRITDKYSKGCNTMIKNLQASMVLDSEDILYTYGLTKTQEEKRMIQLDFDDEIVYNVITNDEIHYEQIYSTTNIEPKKLNTILMRLELKGLIKKLSGNYYCK